MLEYFQKDIVRERSGNRAQGFQPLDAFQAKDGWIVLGALGEEGASHVIDILIEETQAAFGQLGALTPEGARSVVIRHNGALHF